METLTKLILNNQIVEMRKCVRQSRIHSIHKLSREIKKLKEKKGTDEQKNKNLKKAERFVEEIGIMKKTKDDDISKFALVNERTMIDITNDVKETLENKAFARLVHHEAVVRKVKLFRERFPDWRETIFPLLEVLGEKYKNKKRVKKKPVHENQAISSKRSVKTKPNKNVPEVVHSKSGTWIVEEMKNVEESVHLERNVKSSSRPSKALNTNSIQLIGPSKENVKADPNRVQRLGPSKENESESDQVQYTGPVDEKVNDSRKRNAEKSIGTSERDEDHFAIKEETVTVSGAVDPFFLKKDNTEYISISAKENTNNTEPEPYDEPSFVMENNDGPRFDYESKRSKKAFFGNEAGFRKLQDREVLRSRNSFSRTSNKFESSKEIENNTLHPSWAAKKKQTQIVQFEGKKIKFDES